MPGIKPKKLSFLIVFYFLITILPISFGVLIWSSINSTQIFKSELEVSLNHVHDLVDNIMESKIDHLSFIMDDLKKQFISSEFFCNDTGILEESLRDSMYKLGQNRLDILILSTLNEQLCLDVSSKFFPTENINEIIIKNAPNLLAGDIIRYHENSTDLSVMIKSEMIIDSVTGEVLGFLTGGWVLNKNLSILESIRQKTKSRAVFLYEGENLIGETDKSTTSISQIMVEEITIGNSNTLNFKKIFEGIDGSHELIASFRNVHIRNLKTSINIGLVSENKSLSTLQGFYMNSGIFLLFILTMFLVISLYIMGKLIMPPLLNLIDYSVHVSFDDSHDVYRPGIVKDFNEIGFSMEDMVDRLNAGKENLIEEIAERKLIEKKIIQLNSELDKRVERRTEEIKNVNKKLTEKISEYEQVTNELSKLSQAIHQSASTVLITSLDGLIEFVNPSFTRITGYSVEDVIGKNPEILNSGKNPPYLFSDMWESIANGETWQGEMLNRKKNGDLFWEYATISPIIDNSGKITHFVAIKDDISQRKKLEEELVEARIVAERANRAKSAFLANMSHEIRTPMNSIMGFIQIVLKMNTISKVEREYLEIAFKSSTELLFLINDILDSSKLEAGKLEIENRPFNLPNLLLAIIESLNFKVEEKALTLSLELEQELNICIVGDTNRLRQVLLNLLSNAIKFTEKGSIVIKVIKSENGFITFSVIDSGIGLKPELIQTIFQPFSQADQSTARKYGGTGLGTTISKQLVSLMGGKIWIESEYGMGSIFSFTIPLIIPECAEKCNPECKEFRGSEIESISKDIRSFKILVAEDIPENAILVSVRLKQELHEVDVVTNGREAVEAYRKKKYDIILMDVHMPEVDGLEATRQIREIESETEARSRISIIALTASIMEDDHQKCLDAGMDYILGKPIQFDKLFTTMERFIPKEKGQLIQKTGIRNINQDEIVSPVDLPGIDFEKGMKTWQNKDVYEEALRSYGDKYSVASVRLSQYLVENKIEEAVMFSHAMRGVSGNLSIPVIEKLCTSIETSLKNNDLSMAQKWIDELSDNIIKVSESINKIHRHEDAFSDGNKIINLEEISQMIQKLFEDFNKGEIDEGVIEEVLHQLHGSIGSDILENLRKKVDSYDFESAGEILVQIDEILENGEK